MSSTIEGPLDESQPYYTWEVNPDGVVYIYLECCADSFTDQQFDRMARAKGYTK